MWKEFRTFIARGNVLDLAVGVMIGAAFGNITKSLTDDILTPIIGLIFGGLDFSSHFIRLGAIPASYKGSPDDYAALKHALTAKRPKPHYVVTTPARRGVLLKRLLPAGLFYKILASLG